MRLAIKIFAACSLVLLVLAGVAVWSLNEVAKLASAERTITVRAAEALRLQVSIRNAVIQANRLDMRNLVFADREYAAASSAQAARIAQDLDRLEGFLTSAAERARLGRAVQDFAQYRNVAARVRALRGQGDVREAEHVLQSSAQPIVDRVVASLDGLVELTRSSLDRAQTEATVALGETRSEVQRLRDRTLTAVAIAMGVAFLAALVGTAAIAVRLTRALGRLSEATRAVAEGDFRGPVPIETRDEVGQLARAFNGMVVRLREIDQLKEQFYATVSHELRSPLNAMRESARLIEEKAAGPLTDKQERLISIMRRSTERLLRLVSEVLDLSRARAGLLPLERGWFDSAAAIGRALEEVRPQAEQRGIDLRFESDARAPRIFGDPDRIVQMTINLVANALRFTPPGGSVTVRLADADGEVRIEVEDTGVGIRADLQPKMFQRFHQAHPGQGGTGLGLAIVRALAEAHGGRVGVESEEGKGSRFTITLPRGPADPVGATEAQPSR
jgi:signal transduction histidine kinase